VPARDVTGPGELGERTTRSESFIVDADREHARKLLHGNEMAWFFTSERAGNAELFSVHPEGMPLELIEPVVF